MPSASVPPVPSGGDTADRGRASSAGSSAASSAYWPVPLVRAVPLLVTAAVVTFSRDHSPFVGLVSFGVAALVGGLLLTVGVLLRLDDRSSRTLQVVQGVTTVVAGAVALAASSAGLAFFVALVSGWALVAGALELVAGLRRRGRSPLARDWISVGVLTLALGVVFLVVPLDYAQPLGGVEQIEGELTSSTVLVGVLGAWAAVVGVFLVIAGLSLRWQTDAGHGAAGHDGAGHGAAGHGAAGRTDAGPAGRRTSTSTSTSTDSSIDPTSDEGQHA
ncbi:DUF308 domain-containing protein [Frigoribacterium sp. PhB116]|uniref:DUF308 domain-containing protein n=1 Tax=Frigoribacterium sp. PhB116 TaxID=2485174 RepID=UPI0010EF5DFC|nr:DUF308 domain-containing protein [Frigoribacterium sp. PhB116]TDT63071.1 uncharacterized membrane protein HdeD (DUF308 family) [Frigoribacterium sp. PhB116]